MKNVKKKIQRIPYLFLLMLFSCLTASAQQGITVKGTVVDDNGETIIGASVVVKGNNSIGTISDIDGNFVLTVPNEKSVLVVSFVGMEAQEVKATSGKSGYRSGSKDKGGCTGSKGYQRNNQSDSER